MTKLNEKRKNDNEQKIENRRKYQAKVPKYQSIQVDDKTYNNL
jgi:hypothetical protein